MKVFKIMGRISYIYDIKTSMDLSDKERYSISKVGEDTFILTDADTLQTWQIEILRNQYKDNDLEKELTEDSASE